MGIICFCLWTLNITKISILCPFSFSYKRHLSTISATTTCRKLLHCNFRKLLHCQFLKFVGAKLPITVDQYVDSNAIFEKYWNRDDDRDLKRRKEAELLVKDELSSQYICGFVVYNDEAKNKLISMGVGENSIVVKPSYYF